MSQAWHFLVDKFSDLIQFCYHISELIGLPNYGVAIIIITLLIKVVLYPLTNSQLKSMRAMQEIQPKMKALQEKHKDTPEKLQSEMMSLYKENGVNPLGGCLPLLIQLPILMAFYQALAKFKYSVAAHAIFLWVPNLSQKDPIYLLPLLAGLTTYVQQKVSMVDTNDPTQKSMLFMMPILIAWMATRFPSGLALYWVVFNLLSILQQLYVNYRSKQNLALSGTNGQVIEVAESAEIRNKDRNEGKGGKKNADSRKKGKKR
ncbi:MAG: YidC/Oxa1 family membrane protein insertase [Chitinophagales bacterium]